MAEDRPGNETDVVTKLSRPVITFGQGAREIVAWCGETPSAAGRPAHRSGHGQADRHVPVSAHALTCARWAGALPAAAGTAA